MKTIKKGNEPSSLTKHRCKPFSDYDNYPDKNGLRRSLVDEQGMICAYCMQRIRPDESHMKIEHWHCQTEHLTEQLDYSNLLGVCLGNMGKAEENQHCDTKKGNCEIQLNPANPLHHVEELIQFLGNGRVKSPDPQIDDELNKILNLNEESLVKNRASVLDSFIRTLPDRGELKQPRLQKMLQDWYQPSNGVLSPFCMVVVHWLRKKMNRAQRI